MMTKYLNITRTSCEILTCSSMGVKPYQLMVPYWPDIAKSQSETKRISNLLKPLSPRRRLFFHDHWPALKMTIRELFVRTFATKYLN